MSIEKIPELLLNCLKTLNYDFDNSAYWRKFGALKTNLERVNYVYEDLKKYNLFPKLVNEPKSDEAALKFRENGKKLHTLGFYKDALMSYTCALQTAKTAKILAQIYANRSACLLKLGFPKECADIYKQPLASADEKCKQKLNTFIELYFDEANLKDIDRALKLNPLCEKKKKLTQRKKEASNLEIPPRDSYEKPPKCPKNVTKIETSPEFGRHIVAKRDIQIGEVIHVEKPFTCILEQDFLTHCYECMELCYNLIPCKTCNRAAFCSETCKKKAMGSYHRFECPILTTVIEYGLKPSLLALKISLLSSQEQRYGEIAKLQAATDERTVKNLFLNTIVAAVLFELLQNNTKFKPEESFKETLLLQLLVCSVNAIRISETSPNLIEHKSYIFAVGLYPVASFFNHSCCYNVEKTHHGATIVLRAVKTIKKGEQCCITYGLEYDTAVKDFRQMYLKAAYYFTCTCNACAQNWPSRNDNLLIFNSLLIEEVGLRHSEFKATYMKILGGDVDEAKSLLEKLVLALQRSEQYEPWGNVLEIQKLMTICYRTFGNKKWV